MLETIKKENKAKNKKYNPQASHFSLHLYVEPIATNIIHKISSCEILQIEKLRKDPIFCSLMDYLHPYLVQDYALTLLRLTKDFSDKQKI